MKIPSNCRDCQFCVTNWCTLFREQIEFTAELAPIKVKRCSFSDGTFETKAREVTIAWSHVPVRKEE